MNKVQKVNYRGEMWARKIGSLFCINSLEKNCLLSEVNLLRHLRPFLRHDNLQNAWFPTSISCLVTFAFSNSIDPEYPSVCSRSLAHQIGFFRLITTDLTTRYRCNYGTSLVRQFCLICVTRWSPTSCSLPRSVNFTETITAIGHFFSYVKHLSNLLPLLHSV